MNVIKKISADTQHNKVLMVSKQESWLHSVVKPLKL